MLANLASIVRPRTSSVALHFDNGFPPGIVLKCEPQVFALRLAQLQICVHIANVESEVGEKLGGGSGQFIPVSPEGSPGSLIGSLAFRGQFYL